MAWNVGRTRVRIFGGCLALVLAALLVLGVLRRRDGPSAPTAEGLLAGARMASANTGRPVLWVLSIGVSKYADQTLALRFAAADARGLAEALKRQESGPLYSKVETVVLLDGDVTRASILRSMDDFLGRAAPIDVGVVYLAGHGVRDPVRDTYYFLPADASAEKPHIEGLDMGEFNRQLRLVHRNLRHLVVILDTCHSGAAAWSADERLGVDLAARLVPAEGLYILAAAQSGESSIESPSIGHGLFTDALISGLNGAAVNPEGLVTVFSLASNAARLVRKRSDERQHPYQAIVGEDLALAADPMSFARVTPPPLPSPAQVPEAAPRERVAVISFQNLRPDPQQDWMEKALRQDLTTALASVPRLDVYEEPEMRFLARGATDPFEAAQRAGMEKLVSGSYWVEGDRITITADVKSVGPLQRIASAKIEGAIDEFSVLRGRLIVELLDQWRLGLLPGEAERIVSAASSDPTARKLLYGAETSGKELHGPHPTPAARADSPGASLGRSLDRFLGFAQPSYAADGTDVEAELRSTLENYRTTFMRRDVDALARFYVVFTDQQREALTRYFGNADQLEIEFADIRIAIIGNDASISFRRSDRFIDRQTGEREQVVVRSTKRLTKGPEGWQISPEE